MKRELGGQAKVIATGGWAELVVGECRSIDHHDPLLNLEGLRIVYERNRDAGLSAEQPARKERAGG
jgi:type III pantothenate kinase